MSLGSRGTLGKSVQVTDGIPSNPPPDEKKVTNLSVRMVGETPKLNVEFEKNG